MRLPGQGKTERKLGTSEWGIGRQLVGREKEGVFQMVGERKASSAKIKGSRTKKDLGSKKLTPGKGPAENSEGQPTQVW